MLLWGPVRVVPDKAFKLFKVFIFDGLDNFVVNGRLIHDVVSSDLAKDAKDLVVVKECRVQAEAVKCEGCSYVSGLV